ncbi:MAG: protein TolR [Pseudomonadota bacterium]
MAMGTMGGAGPGRAARRRRAAGRPMSEINVTPFVDVMLVLLIIFMVAAPLLTVGVPLELPRSDAQSLPAEQETPLTVSIDRTGTVFLQETAVEDGSLVARLRAIAGERAAERIYLRADGALGYARVMEVMGTLSSAGFTSIALVTDQRSDREQ